MKPLIMAAAFALATFAQPWQAGESLYQNTTQYANQVLETQAMNFGMSMQGQIDLAMYCQNDAALPSVDGVGILPVCSGKAVSTPVTRRYRTPARKPKAIPGRDF
jgi:hypothetical protein